MDDVGNICQDYTGHTDEQSWLLWSKADGQQARLTVSEFRGDMYIGIRIWMLGIDDVWFPTRSGFSMPYNLDTTSRLFAGLVNILSNGEVLEEVKQAAEKVELEKSPE